jgi:hypothetical protein
MSEPMVNENLIGTLEQSLRQTRKAQNLLVGQLKEVEAEVKRLSQEIEALEKTEQAIYSLLSRIRSGSHPNNLVKNMRDDDDDYEIPADLQNAVYRNQNNQDNQYYNNRDNYSNNRDNQYSNNQDNPRNNPNNRRYSNDNYRDNSGSYKNNNQNRNNNNRGVTPVNSHIEPVSQRFSDRTITQACTLILREADEPLHVNQLYNLLVAGGFKFKGNNPTISIAVSLNRNRRFEKIAPSTFDLVIRDASQTAS